MANDFTRPEQLREAPLIEEWVGASQLVGNESAFLLEIAKGKRRRLVERCTCVVEGADVVLLGSVWQASCGGTCASASGAERAGGGVGQAATG